MVGIVLQNALNSSISAQYLRVSTTMMSRCTDTICRGSPLSTTADHLPCLICAAFGADRATFIVSAVSCSTSTVKRPLSARKPHCRRSQDVDTPPRLAPTPPARGFQTPRQGTLSRTVGCLGFFGKKKKKSPHKCRFLHPFFAILNVKKQKINANFIFRKLSK